ncbi:short chain dehydrogenase family protein [Mycobacterium xenopi 4042]|uniref:Short chain dehydrogenase family protein n=1 Tax=Mycobacterium xenopi 4042 TaxID=1299334 RepID=X8DME4_MYCXE|nr:short chain dehydrogenase family protein [Mycobacterium xenopi 3993]EUA68660.1 short chain dehydrogenase family protein [Mycobacterium xenopi 4042]
MDSIKAKTVVITGAARGIGYATAKALLARGARVVIGDRDVDVLDKAVTDLSGLGPVSGHPLDVTDRESFAAFLDKARADGADGQQGRVDVLINNAGVMPVGPSCSSRSRRFGRPSRSTSTACSTAASWCCRRWSTAAADTSSTSRRWPGWSPYQDRWSTRAPNSPWSGCPPRWPTRSPRMASTSRWSCRRSPTPS